jgi:tetratricopeptide (TPR) repeat protein
MSKTVLAGLLALALSAPAAAQGVKVTLTDGKVVEGHLEGFEHGRYRIRLASGTVRELEEQLVHDIILTERPAAEAPRGSGSPAEEARAAFERGDTDLALQKIALALRELDRQREDLTDLAARVTQAHFDRLLERRDAGRLSDALRRVVPTLPPESRREVLTRLAERFADQARSAPQESFTAAFAEILARLADEGTINETLRGQLADVFVRMAQAAQERKNATGAVLLFRGALRVDPSRREALGARLLELALGEARRLFESGDPVAAVRAAREALELDPANAEARRILEDADFAQVRQEVDAALGSDAAAVLREFLARTTRVEHRAWAEEALGRASAQPDARPPAVAAQMRRYFPVKPGRFMLYRRADGEIHERIRTDSVERDGDVVKVYYTLREIYRNWSTSKAYLLEIEKDAIVMATGPEREPLLKFPLRAGDSWTWTSRGREFRRTVRATDETVTLGRDDRRRTYEGCLVVDFTSTVERDGTLRSLTSRSTYAPGVGLVTLEFLEPEFQKFNLELVDFGQDAESR